MNQPTRRELLEMVTAGAGTLAAWPVWAEPKAAPEPAPQSRSSRAILALYESLSEAQKSRMCFDWDHRGPSGLPLRLHVTNNWAVSPAAVASFSRAQQALIEEVFNSVLNAGWTERLHQQARDDTGRDWTQDRKVAIFGRPGSGRCQCVISGFHLTFRALDGPAGAVAFGGAIAHGHQPSGFHERVGHPGNIFWYQARRAHELYRLLDDRQKRQALLTRGMPWYEFNGRIDRRVIRPDSRLEVPLEPDVRFRGRNVEIPGLPIGGLTRDQRAAVQQVLEGLLEPYQSAYREQVLACLRRQGGLERCHLIVYQEHTLGREGEWDNWRIEGPSFVWYFRGTPHVHIWIHVADDPDSPVTSHFG